MFIIAGESLIDLVPAPDGDLTPAPGGAPYNFARALALQGVEAGYLNPISGDGFGRLLRATLLQSGARHLGPISRLPTSLALVGSDERGLPQYSFYRSQVADRDTDAGRLLTSAPATVEGFHTGGLALVPPDDDAVLRVLRHFRERGVLCSVDVNMRPQVAGSQGVDPSAYRDAALAVAAAADVVKVSDEDLVHLGLDADPERAAAGLLQRGCRLVLVTLGAHGAWAFHGGLRAFAAAPHVAVVDTVGAGDCFFAGFMAFLQRRAQLSRLRDTGLDARTLAAALRHASASAALNIERRGCQPPDWDSAELRSLDLPLSELPSSP